MGGRRHQCPGIEAAAYSQPHTGHHPKTGRCRKTSNRQALFHYGTGAQKANTAYNLGRQAGRISIRTALNILIKGLRENHDQTSAKTDQYIGPQSS